MRPLPLLALLVACAEGRVKETSSAAPPSNHDPDEGADDPELEPWEPEPVIGIANVDDDNEDGVVDWQGALAAEEDDLATLVVPADLLSKAGPLQLSLSGAVESVRVLYKGEILLDEEHPTAELADPGGDAILFFELGGFLASALLEVEAEAVSVEIPIRSAPVVLNHHLQQAELQMSLDVPGTRWGNEAFVAGFEDVLDEGYIAVNGWAYDYDPWLQDEIEIGTLTAPGGLEMQVVIDGIRTEGGRWLDGFAEDNLFGPGFGLLEIGDGRATSQDSFGNVEVTPPLTANGVHYPYGRVYWGEYRGQGVNDEMAAFLEAQVVQAPFQVDTGWLCVGHVDEASSFVPDETAPRGFRLLFADTRSGLAFLDALDPELDLPRYRSGHGYATAGELQEDESLRLLNEDIQAEHLDPMLEIFREELELTEDEIIYLPALFERVSGCGGGVVSLIPGTVNMAVVPMEDGVHVFMADPFLREDEDDLSSDAMVPVIEDLLPESLVPHWLDDWNLYHLGLGEVHCGTNTVRTPAGAWWTDAAHLLETEAR